VTGAGVRGVRGDNRRTLARRALTFGRSLALITAAGALVRLVLAARQQVGFDEDFTLVAVQRPFGDMLDTVGRDSSAPLFYVLEWLATRFGSVPWNLRLVPLAAGVALIPLLAAVGRRVAGDRAGLWTAAFVAALPATLQSSTNARMYGLAGALMVAAALLLWRALERPAGRRWIAFALVAAAAIWTNYFSVLALGGLVLAGAWLRPPRRVYGLACLACAISIASILPWLLFASAQLSHAGQGFWVDPLSPASLAGTAGQLFAGPQVQDGLAWHQALFALQVVAAVAGWLALAAAAWVWRRLSPESQRAAIFCLLACSSVAALVVVSLWRPLLEARYAGVMWLPLLALAGTGLSRLPRPVAGALLAAVAVPSLALSLTLTNPGTAELLPQVEARVGEHDLVDVDPNHYLLVLGQGSPQLRSRLHIVAEASPPWYFGIAAYPANAVIHSIPADVVAGGGLVFFIGDRGANPVVLPPGYVRQDQSCEAGTCLTIFGPPR
jgi:hypothetical protein